MDIQTIRSNSPVTQRYAYFDTAAASAPPTPVIDAVTTYLVRTRDEGPYLPSFRKETYLAVEQVREKLATLINSEPEEIAFTKNATEAICLVAQGIDWQTGDEIIVFDTEILSNLVPWLRLADTRGVKVVHVAAREDGRISPDDVAAAITSRTRLITFSSLVNSTGALQPVQELCALAARHGVMSLVNASQSLGMVATDVRALNCDFLAACGRKGLRAIEGTGLLYAKAERLAALEPCLVGWWNSTVNPETMQVTLPKTGRRLEAGCPNVPAILSLGAAIDYAQQIGVSEIEKQVRNLTKYAIESLGSLPGFQLYGPANIQHRIGIVPFNFEGIAAGDLVDTLALGNVVIEAGHFMAHAVMRRFGIAAMARISLHYFNTTEEIDRCVGLIDNAIRAAKTTGVSA